MTNAEIILRESIKLAKEGIIKTTDRMIEVDGQAVQEPEEIHTFNAWKMMGYTVKKGEHAKASFPIWKFKANKKDKKEDELDGEGETGKMFMAKAFFFTEDQVQPTA